MLEPLLKKREFDQKKKIITLLNKYMSGGRGGY